MGHTFSDEKTAEDETLKTIEKERMKTTEDEVKTTDDEVKTAGDGPVMPVLFLSHGGGPCFFMEPKGRFVEIAKGSDAAKWYMELAEKQNIPRPKAIVVISAHWETKHRVAVTSNESPSLVYDYYGFPPHTYELKYPAPGSPELAKKVCNLLNENDVSCVEDSSRGFDHGMFIPLKLIYPQADIPVIQLSLHGSLDLKLHYKIGEILSVLRSEEILIIGSGSATHNLRQMGEPHDKPRVWAKEFITWLSETVEKDAEERRTLLMNWNKSPSGKTAHPREEHLVPLHVAAGAAKGDVGKQINDIWAMGTLSLASYKFG